MRYKTNVLIISIISVFLVQTGVSEPVFSRQAAPLVDVEVTPVHRFGAPLPNPACLEKTEDEGCYLVLLQMPEGYTVDYMDSENPQSDDTMFIENYNERYAIVIPSDGARLKFIRNNSEQMISSHHFPPEDPGIFSYYKVSIIDLLALEYLLEEKEEILAVLANGRIIEGLLVSDAPGHYVIEKEEGQIPFAKTMVEEFYILSEYDDLSELPGMSSFELPEFAGYLSAKNGLAGFAFEYRANHEFAFSFTLGSFTESDLNKLGFRSHAFIGESSNKLEVSFGITLYRYSQAYSDNVTFIRPNVFLGYRYEMKDDFLFQIGISTYSEIDSLFSSDDYLVNTSLSPKIGLGYSF